YFLLLYPKSCALGMTVFCFEGWRGRRGDAPMGGVQSNTVNWHTASPSPFQNKELSFRTK
ncbi:MAG: hypothetical protein ABII90_00850, partial [Bacteroidota bacterium]